MFEVGYGTDLKFCQLPEEDLFFLRFVPRAAPRFAAGAALGGLVGRVVGPAAKIISPLAAWVGNALAGLAVGVLIGRAIAILLVCGLFLFGGHNWYIGARFGSFQG